MSAFAGSEGAYQTLTGGNIFGPRPARTLQRVPPVRQQTQAEYAPEQQSAPQASQQQASGNTDDMWRRQNAAAKPPSVLSNQVNVNSAPNMSAWNERRNGVASIAQKKQPERDPLVGVLNADELRGSRFEQMRKQRMGRVMV